MRKPEYTRALTDDTTLSVLQGNEQIAFPIKFSRIKSSILGGFTEGSVLFAGAGGVISESPNLFWDDANSRLGIGTNTPTTAVHIGGSNNLRFDNQLRDNRNNSIFTQSSDATISNRSSTFLNATYTSLYIPSPVSLGLGISSGVAARLHVQGSGTASATYTAQFHNSTGTNNALVIRDDGNVGIGTTSPLGLTHIKNANVLSAGLPNAQMIIEGFSSTTLQLAAHNTGVINIAFGDQDDGNDGQIIYSNASRYMSFDVANNERLRITSSGNLLINTTTDTASAKLKIESTTQGFLPPRMTTTEKNDIALPVAGLMVYDTTLNKLCVFTTTWETITSL